MFDPIAGMLPMDIQAQNPNNAGPNVPWGGVGPAAIGAVQPGVGVAGAGNNVPWGGVGPTTVAQPNAGIAHPTTPAQPGVFGGAVDLSNVHPTTPAQPVHPVRPEPVWRGRRAHHG